MRDLRTEIEASRPRLHSPEGTEILWHEFWKLQDARPNAPGVRARVTLTQPERGQRQFVVESGSGHHFLIDDTAGGTGPGPVELVAAALAGCTAFDVIATLRDRKHQRVSAYEVRVEAEQAERPPQVFVAVRIHHIVTGYDLDPAMVSEAIQLSETKNAAVAAMVGEAAVITTTFEVVNEPAETSATGRLAASPTPGAPMSWSD
jgi:putative redox protein